jgi:hypothetical protein
MLKIIEPIGQAAKLSRPHRQVANTHAARLLPEVPQLIKAGAIYKALLASERNFCSDGRTIRVIIAGDLKVVLSPSDFHMMGRYW